jgi:hypothetical protein
MPDPTTARGDDNNPKTALDAAKPTLFPNPANEMVTVDLRGVNNAASILIMDKEGRLVARQDNITNENQVQIDISFLSAGTYFVQVVAVNGEMQTMKLVKL